MRKWVVILTAFALIGFGASGASAVSFNMFESDFNRDGVILPTFSGPILGPITYIETFNAPGIYFGAVFVDPEIDQAINTYYNEYGSVVGTPAAGQSWEIDEPGFVFGNIYSNFTNGTLDLSNGVPFTSPDDVSMALGWNFTLNTGETANLNFTLSTIQPTSGFYLVQTDPDSQASLYFSSDLTITQGGGTTPVPEPATMLLLGAGLAGLFGLRKKFKK